MYGLSPEDLKEFIKLAKDNNISVNELIKLIQNSNPKFVEIKEKLKLRKWGIIIGGILSILSLSGAIALLLLASPSAAVIFMLICATFVFAGGTFALSSMQDVSTRDFSAMVKEIVTSMKKEDKTPLNIPYKEAKPMQYELIKPNLSQEQDENK